MKSVGERIKQARLAKGLSAEALAMLVGYKTQSGIANIENRSNGSGGNKVARIATELEVPVEWLLSGPDSDDVPFIRAKPSTVTRVPEVKAIPSDPSWPFPSIQRERIEALLAGLGPARASNALEDIERYLNLLLERWEREVHEANNGAAGYGS